MSETQTKLETTDRTEHTDGQPDGARETVTVECWHGDTFEITSDTDPEWCPGCGGRLT
jgi:hypothetical protein